MEGGYLFSSVLVQGLYQLICSAALPQNLSGSATEAAKWVLYSPPPPADDSARQPRPPRAPRGPGATNALRAGPAPRAGEDPVRDPPSPPGPVTLRHCSQDGFIAAGCPPPPAGCPAPGPGVHSSGDSWGAPDFQKPVGSRREGEAAAERSPGPWSCLDSPLELPGKTDLERLGKQQAGVGVGEWGLEGGGQGPGPQREKSSPRVRRQPRGSPTKSALELQNVLPSATRLGPSGEADAPSSVSTNKFSNKQVVAASLASSVQSRLGEAYRLWPAAQTNTPALCRKAPAGFVFFVF